VYALDQSPGRLERAEDPTSTFSWVQALLFKFKFLHQTIGSFLRLLVANLIFKAPIAEYLLVD
jgi:hypothetical protein